jgi:hypothetical protein
MTHDLEIPFERVTYRRGQRLDARDLRDDQRRDARLRELHVRHLHDTWGIALGFEVTSVSDSRSGASREATGILVGPGYAIDERGRDLLLPESVRPALPSADGRFVLMVAYREDKDFQDPSGLPVHCFGDGLDLRTERVRFAWRTPDEVRFGPEVPVVQITVANGAMNGAPDVRVRRYTQPFVRPHIDVRVTDEGRSGWRDWVEGAPSAQQGLGLELDVDTSEAGFLRTPFYFGALQGDFGRGQDPPLFEADPWPQGEATFPLEAMGFIAAANVDGFTYRILNMHGAPFVRNVSPAEAERRGWRIAWCGLEPVKGSEPTVDVSRIFSLSGFRLSGLTAVTFARAGR